MIKITKNVRILGKAGSICKIPTTTITNPINKTMMIGAYIPRYSFVNLPVTSQYYHTQLPNSLPAALQLAKKEKKLNQKCYLLEHAAELIIKDPKLMTNTVKQQFVEELKLWEGTEGRFIRIATVAWVMRKMNLRNKLKNLYEDIVRRVDEDQWYVNFQQSVKAIQAFSDYPDDKIRNRIYQKIERNLGLTLSDFGMEYFQRICLSLLEANRYQSKLWNKIEEFVLRNLGMPYTPKVFFDIFKAFAISRNGSDTFYEISQLVLFRGHLYSNIHHIRSNLADFDSTGQYFAMLIQTYAIVNKHTPIPLEQDFLDYLYKSMKFPRLQYKQIESLTTLLKYLPQFEQFHEDQIEEIIQDIIQHKNFQEYSSTDSIIELYQQLLARYGKIPQKIMRNVDQLVIKDMQRKIIPLQTAIEIVGYLLQSKEEGNEELLARLDQFIERRYKYLPPNEVKNVQQALDQLPYLSEKLDKSRLLLPGKN